MDMRKYIGEYPGPTIKLTEEQINEGCKIGRQRFEDAIALNLKAKGAQCTHQSLAPHIHGAQCEIAFGHHFKLEYLWENSLDGIAKPDFITPSGRYVDVKSTKYSHGKLILPSDSTVHRDWVYVLATMHAHVVTLRGWITGGEVLDGDFWHEHIPPRGNSGHIIPQQDMHRFEGYP